jgi:hypothetical protein
VFEINETNLSRHLSTVQANYLWFLNNRIYGYIIEEIFFVKTQREKGTTLNGARVARTSVVRTTVYYYYYYYKLFELSRKIQYPLITLS